MLCPLPIYNYSPLIKPHAESIYIRRIYGSANVVNNVVWETNSSSESSNKAPIYFPVENGDNLNLSSEIPTKAIRLFCRGKANWFRWYSFFFKRKDRMFVNEGNFGNWTD